MKLFTLFFTILLATGLFALADPMDTTDLARGSGLREIPPSRAELSGSNTKQSPREIPKPDVDTDRVAAQTARKTKARRDEQAIESKKADLNKQLKAAVDKRDFQRAARISKQLDGL